MNDISIMISGTKWEKVSRRRNQMCMWVCRIKEVMCGLIFALTVSRLVII